VCKNQPDIYEDGIGKQLKR